MHTNLLLSVPVRYWQDFQDTLARATNANIYIFDANGAPFSRFSLPAELCQEVNKGRELHNEKCIDFYKLACGSLEEEDTITCPYGLKLCAYRLGSYAQRIGYLMVAPSRHTTLVEREEEIAFITKAHNVYRTNQRGFQRHFRKEPVRVA